MNYRILALIVLVPSLLFSNDTSDDFKGILEQYGPQSTQVQERDDYSFTEDESEESNDIRSLTSPFTLGAMMYGASVLCTYGVLSGLDKIGSERTSSKKLWAFSALFPVIYGVAGAASVVGASRYPFELFSGDIGVFINWGFTALCLFPPVGYGGIYCLDRLAGDPTSKRKLLAFSISGCVSAYAGAGLGIRLYAKLFQMQQKKAVPCISDEDGHTCSSDV